MSVLMDDERLYFDRMPEMLPLYRTLRDRLEEKYPDLEIRVNKTQISFRNRHVFAMTSLPWRKVKGWPERYLLVSFGLPYHKEAPRIAQAAEAYPRRWTHHVLVENETDLDGELMGWIDEAFQFSMVK